MAISLSATQHQSNDWYLLVRAHSILLFSISMAASFYFFILDSVSFQYDKFLSYLTVQTCVTW